MNNPSQHPFSPELYLAITQLDARVAALVETVSLLLSDETREEFLGHIERLEHQAAQKLIFDMETVNPVAAIELQEVWEKMLQREGRA